MANTTNLVIEKPVPGGSNNVWGTTLNTGTDSFDTAIAGTLSKSVAGSANVSLTDAEALNANHIYTGALTGSIAVHVPIKSRRYQVFNNTTGSHTLKVKTSSETNGTTVDQGTTMVLFCDATSVIDGTSGSGSTSVSDFTANNLKVPVCASVTNLVAATGSFTTKVSGVAGEFSGIVSAATFDGNLLGNVTGNITGNVTGDVDGATGSYSACVSATNFVAATGSFTTKVSGVAAEFSGNVSAAQYYGGGGNLTGITAATSVTSFTVNQLGVVTAASITSLVAPYGSFTTKVSGAAAEFSGIVSASSLVLTTDLAVASGGTGASSAAAARSNLGAAALGSNSDITALTGLTTDLSVAQGGTGASTHTANNVLVGAGTSPIGSVAPGTSGNVLTSNGTLWQSSAAGSGGATDINGLSDALTNSSGGTIGLGTGALANDDGSENRATAVGKDALGANTSGANNTAVGHASLDANTTGYSNSGLGQHTLGGNTTGYHNTALGADAMRNGVCTGHTNVGVGSESLYQNTTGYSNSGLGFRSLNANTTGYRNTAVGKEALILNTTGATNVAVGTPSMAANVSGEGNTAVGTSALTANTTGSENVGVGAFALDANTTGANNVAVGQYALSGVTTSAYNTGLGQNAGIKITTGSYNVAVGANSLKNNLTGGYNIAIGYLAMEQNTASSNVGIGFNALNGCSSGTRNTAVGDTAGKDLSTGSDNTSLGSTAGDLVTTGSNNTSLGSGADPTANNATNEVTLGNSSISAIRCQVQTISALSDRRDKKDIEELPVGLDFINDLKPVKFVWNMRDGGKVDIQEHGFIAQDLDEAQIKAGAEDYLSLVLKNNPDKLEAAYGKLVPILVKAVQELSEEVNILKSKLNN